MELKKISNLFLVLLLILCFAVPVAAEQSGVISLGRIGVAMPEISVEIKGSGYDKNTISATLDSEKLTVEDVFKYEIGSNSSCAYILVDLSTSMYGSFDLVKSNIVSYIETLSDDDKVVLITFGETKVNTVLTGSETREEAIDAVNKLKCNENGTLFYEALNQAYQLSNSSENNFDREYVIAFSDGIDVQKGSSTFDEVIKLYDSRALPLYAACSYNTSKAASDKFGELARASGGSFSIIKSKDSFNNFLTQINDVTIVKLKASSNYADGKEKQLSVKVDSSMVNYNVPIVRSIADTSAPEVKELTYDIEKDAFVISFSENVIGAASNAAYKITNSKGKKLEVSEVFYSENDNIYEIKTKTPITKGTYTFEFFGIKDDSKEANSLNAKQVVEVKKSNNSAVLPIWATVLIVVGSVLVIGIAVSISILSAKKRNSQSKTDDALIVPENNSVEDIEYAEPMKGIVKHHIKTNDAIRIRLKIQTGKTSEQNIETNIVSSLIVGRSDTCDIYIDDTKLSRQHFVIENDDGNIYVMDLQSRNGTMLNGIRINSRQRLSNGDKIMAGLSDIIITILGR
mgnify:CR=1 FL=1